MELSPNMNIFKSSKTNLVGVESMIAKNIKATIVAWNKESDYSIRKYVIAPQNGAISDK